jgi:hypothetical protein
MRLRGDPSFPNPKSPTSPPSPGRLATGTGGDGGAYPSGAAVGRGGGFLGRCSGELVGGGGGPWEARLGMTGPERLYRIDDSEGVVRCCLGKR